MKEWFVRYVPHDQVPAYQRLGWRVEADTAHHRHYSVFMAAERGVPYIPKEAA